MSTPRPLSDLVAADWADALAPVAGRIEELGRWLRAEVAAIISNHETARAIAEAEGAEGLRDRLAPVDPDTAERLGTGDRQRLARAYEVWLATGRPLGHFHDERQPPVLNDGE